MPKIFRIAVLFRQDRFGSMMLGGFLDMLRYDNCTVEWWNIAENGVVDVVLNKQNAPFAVDRWRSMGINVAELLPRT